MTFENVEGFQVIDFAPPDGGTRISKVRAAVRAIDEYQLYRGAQARRYLRRLLISHTGGSGEYWLGMGVCVLDANYLESVDSTAIAMLLVHEATHGRLDMWGVRRRSINIARAEALCSCAEIGLASRMPGGEGHVQRVLRSLQTRWWEPDANLARQSRRLQQMGAPPWVSSMLDRLR
ncbi:MAG TPA: hypothetical protein VGI97_02355 [Gemmatimonadaceae bacterium]